MGEHNRILRSKISKKIISYLSNNQVDSASGIGYAINENPVTVKRVLEEELYPQGKVRIHKSSKHKYYALF